MIDRNDIGLRDLLKHEIDMPHRMIWLPHNLIAHPLMTILPRSWGDKLHNFTTPKSFVSSKEA